MPDHEQAILARLGGPDFTWTAIELADFRAIERHHKLLEDLRRRVEPDDRVTAPVAEPYGVLLVDIDRVRCWPISRQWPLVPLARPWVIATDLTGVPFADPDQPMRIRPDAPR